MIVEYDPLPVVVDPEAALEDGSPLVHEEFGTNKMPRVVARRRRHRRRRSPRPTSIIERRIVNHRTAGAPIEPRGVLADYRARHADALHSPPRSRTSCALFLALQLGITEDSVRVIAPEVGGGFGAKLQIYARGDRAARGPSRKLGRPVKWIETRSEHMTSPTTGATRSTTCKVGAKRDGTITALPREDLADLGAYQMLLTPFIPRSARS